MTDIQKLKAPPVGTIFNKDNVEFLLKRYEPFVRCHLYDRGAIRDSYLDSLNQYDIKERRYLPWTVGGVLLDHLFERDAQLPIAVPEIDLCLFSKAEMEAFNEQYPQLMALLDANPGEYTTACHSEHKLTLRAYPQNIPYVVVPFIRPEQTEEPAPVFKEPLKAFLFTVEAGKDGKLFQLKLWEIGSNLHEAAGKMTVKTIDNGFESVKVSLHETLALPSSTESSVDDNHVAKIDLEELKANEEIVKECLLTEEELTALIKEAVYLKQKVALLEKWLNQCTPPADAFKNKMFKLNLDSINLGLESIQNQL